MGVQIAEILLKKEIQLDDLSGKTIAIDAFNHLYQFLSTIRQRDGTPLMDSSGNVTSHLAGMFSRSINLLERNIRLVYVFDGKSPGMKKLEQERRHNLKKKAEEKYRIAAEKEDIDEMKKYASRTSRLTEEMVTEAKELAAALGIPVVQAPSEGEAQAALIVKKGHAFAVSSQDSDSLLFGSPKLIRNLSISGRRKKGNKFAYEQVNPEIIGLEENLRELGISHEQLIALSILVGTDFNSDGIKGIGPRHALKLVLKHKSNLDAAFDEAKWSEHYPFGWREIYNIFASMPVSEKYRLEWSEPDAGRLKKLLVGRHDFSEDRIDSTMQKLAQAKKQGKQKGLGEFF
jgi:flap endonuclease-1